MSAGSDTSRRRSLTWLLVASLFMAAFVWACSEVGDDAVDPAGNAGIFAPNSEPNTNTLLDGSPVLDDPSDSATPFTTTTAATIPTEANLKVAFIGDTGTTADFRKVLQLIKRENADLVMVQGDLNYAFGGRAAAWFDVIDSEINSTLPGSTATVTIPYFLAKGNHDSDWAGFGSGLKTRMAQWGISSENGDPTTINYSVVHKGLRLVMVSDSETSPVKRADYIAQRLSTDAHLWKVCSWHKNQRASNIGPKNDEMGWAVYENCRNAGAIVAQGHSHTYSRSKTLTNDMTQTVDPTCTDPFGLCVGPGRNFFFDSSVGGEDLRSPETSIANKPYWGATTTGSFGALFIEFHVGGDPNTAHGYFKTTANVVTDPPASSGKIFFTVTRTP